MKDHSLKLSQNMKNLMMEEKKVSEVDEASRHRREKICGKVLCIGLGHE